jgi:hypothetical protein
MRILLEHDLLLKLPGGAILRSEQQTFRVQHKTFAGVLPQMLKSTGLLKGIDDQKMLFVKQSNKLSCRTTPNSITCFFISDKQSTSLVNNRIHQYFHLENFPNSGLLFESESPNQ